MNSSSWNRMEMERVIVNISDSFSDSKNELSNNLRTHYIFAVLYLFLLGVVMMLVCYLTYRYQVRRRRRRARRASYQRLDDDKPPTYQMIYFSETPPNYGSLVSNPSPDDGSIAMI